MITKADLSKIVDALDYVDFPSFADAIEENCYVTESNSYYSLYQTPYFRPVMEWLEDPSIETVSVMLPSQVGKSVFGMAISIEWARRTANDGVLYYVPNESNANDFVNKKLRPCIEQSPEYSKLIRKNKNGSDDRKAISRKSIKFDNGSEIQVLGVGSKTAMVSKTASLVIIDEYSSMNNAQKDRGDVLELGKTRTASKAYGNRKVLVVSTPRRPDSDIHLLWKNSRQYSWLVPCPNCGKFHFLEFANLKIPKRPEDVGYLEYSDMVLSGKIDIWYECPSCKTKILEHEKTKILNNGKIVCTGNEHLSTAQVSLHLNGLYSLEKWSKIMAKFLRAQGDYQKLEEFQTQTLASPFEAANATRKLKSNDFTRGIYPRGVYPDNTIKVVSGIDVQGDKFYWVNLAYTMEKKIHLVDWKEVKYNIDDMLNPESWIFSLMQEKYNTGIKQIPLDMAIIDCGYNTEKTIELCKVLPKAQGIRGITTRSYSSQYLVKKQSSDLLYVPLQETNELFESLVATKTFILPSNIDDKDEYFTHIFNVVRKNKKFEDRAKGSQNHVDYRDCTRYALSWFFYCNTASEVDKIKYYEDNKFKIEEARKRNMEALNRINLGY